jgi:autotransporter-associated beta strand protein
MKTLPSWFSLNGLCGKATSPFGLAAILFSAALACSLPAVQAAGVWNGGAGGGEFTTAGNWASGPGTSPYNNIVMSGSAGTTVTFATPSTFNGTAGTPGLIFNTTTTAAFNFSGSDLTISGGTGNPAISNLNSGFTQTITNNMTIASGGAAVSANGTGSNLTFNGTIAMGANAFLSNPLAGSTITFNGALSGNGTLTIGQSNVSGGTTILNGASASYTGSPTIQNGTVIVSNAQSLGTKTTTMASGSGVNNIVLLTSAPITIANSLLLQSGPTNTFTVGTNTAGNSTFTGTINMGNDAGGNGWGFLAQGLTVTAVAGGQVAFTGVLTSIQQGVQGLGTGDTLTKTGAGIVVLGNATNTNRYRGATFVNEGTLKAGATTIDATSEGAFGKNSAVTMADVAGATLDITGFSTHIGSLTGGGTTGGNVTLGAAALTTGGDNTSPAAYAGVISGTGALRKVGTGTQILTGANAYTGSTIVNGGTLQVGNGTSGSLNGTTGTALKFGSSSGGSGIANFHEAANVAQGMGALTFEGGDGTVQATYAGSGNSTLTFASVARTAGATGNFAVVGGTNGTTNKIQITAQGAGYINQGTFFNGSSYAWMNAAGTYVRGINYGVDSGTVTTSGTTSVAAIAHVQTTGAVTAQATATFTTLNLSGNNDFTLAASQTLTVNGILKSGNTAGGAIISGGTGIQAASGAELVIRTDGANDALTISSPILANGASSLTKSGAGTLILSGANTYTGVTTIINSVLSTDNLVNGGAASGIGASSNAYTNLVLNDGTLRYTGAGASTDRLFSIRVSEGTNLGTNGGTIDSSGTGALSFTNTGTLGSNSTVGSATLTLTGTNTGANTLASALGTNPNGGMISLAKNGAGTWSLTGNNTYSGATTVNAGTLNVDFSNAARASNIISTASVLNLGGGTLMITGNSSATNSQGFAGIILAANTASSIQMIQNGATTMNGTFNSVFVRNAQSTLDFVLPTSGSMTGVGSNAYLGSLNGIAINRAVPSAVPGNTAFMTVNGTTWATYAAGVIGALGTYSTGNASYLAANNMDVTNGDSVSGVTVNSLRLNSATDGLTLAGTNTIGTGGILVTSVTTNGTITGGTLRAGTGKELVVIDNGVLNIGSAIVDNTTASTFTHSGTGRTTLSGVNTYTGATSVNEGTLLINGSTAAASAVTVSATGTLGGSGTIGGVVTIKSGGTLAPGNSPGLLTVGSLVLEGGSTTAFEIAGTTARGGDYDAINVTTGGGLTLNGAFTINFTNATALSNATDINLFSYTGGHTGDFTSLVATGFAAYAGTWNHVGETFTWSGGGQTLTFSELTGSLTVIPEPATWALLAGVGTFFMVMRRRRRD